MQATRELVRVRAMARTGAARAIREAAGLSLREVAQDLGVNAATVMRWERGHNRPRAGIALRYLRLLDELASR